jgi:hypothetical protein
MKKWFGVATVLLAACPAFAADVATCTPSTEKKTVTVTACNLFEGDGLRGELRHGDT